MSDNSGSNFAIGFLAGAVVGGVVALLFAPRSGSETRAIIREKALDVADTVRFTAEEAVEKAKMAAEKAKEAAVTGVERAREVASDTTKRAQAKIDAFKSA